MPIDRRDKSLKSAMLPPLLVELDRVRRRRERRRRFVGCACLLVVAGVSAMLAWRGAPGPASSIGTARARPVGVSIVVVRTAPDPSNSWTIRTTVGSLSGIDRLDDGALLTYLAAIGRPSGLVRFDGRVLLTGAVSDPSGPG